MGAHFSRGLVISGTTLVLATSSTMLFLGAYSLQLLVDFLILLDLSGMMAMIAAGVLALFLVMPVGICASIHGKKGLLVTYHVMLCLAFIVAGVAYGFLSSHAGKLHQLRDTDIGKYAAMKSRNDQEILLNKMENFVNCSYNFCCSPGQPLVAKIWGEVLPLEYEIDFKNLQATCNEDLANATGTVCELLAFNEMTTVPKCEMYAGETGYRAGTLSWVAMAYEQMAGVAGYSMLAQGLFLAYSIYSTFIRKRRTTVRRRRKVHVLPN